MTQALELDAEGYIIGSVPFTTQEEIDANSLWVNGPAQDGFLRPCWDFTDKVWREGDPDAAAKHLASAQERKRVEIREAFEAESNRPVLIAGVEWHGGYESGMKLDGAMRLAEKGGLAATRFFDTTNTGHDLSIAEANAVVLGVAGKYQQDFDKKQSLMRQIDAVRTEQDLVVISWEGV